MAKGYVWNTGRYGYSEKYDCLKGFDSTKVVEKKGRNNVHVVAETFKRLIKNQNWDQAFDVIDNAVVVNIISIEKRDQLVKRFIPFMSDC